MHAVGFLIDHRYIPDEFRKDEEGTALQGRIKQVRCNCCDRSLSCAIGMGLMESSFITQKVTA